MYVKKKGQKKNFKQVVELFHSLDHNLNERIIKKAFNSIKYQYHV